MLFSLTDKEECFYSTLSFVCGCPFKWWPDEFMLFLGLTDCIIGFIHSFQGSITAGVTVKPNIAGIISDFRVMGRDLVINVNENS